MNINEPPRAVTLATTIVHCAILCAATAVAEVYLPNIIFAATGIAGDFHRTFVLFLAQRRPLAANFEAICLVY